MGPSRSCWNGTTRALRPEDMTSKETRVSYVYYQLKCPYGKKKSGNLFNDPRRYELFNAFVQCERNYQREKRSEQRFSRK